MKRHFPRMIFPLLAVIAGTVFLWSGYSLLNLRFSKGDVHDEYSSFRADPLGCKVLCESLRKLPGVKADRLLRPVEEIENPENSVLIMTGVRFFNRVSSNKNLLDFALSGGRVAILFGTDARGDWSPKKKEAKKVDDKKVDDKKDEASEDKSDEKKNAEDYSGRWKLSVADKRNSKDKIALPVEGAKKEHGFEEMPFYSEICFKISEEWKVLYKCEEKPVVIERKMGRGSLLVIADSTFVSNEALLNDRALKFICHMISNRKNIYFEETSHGVESDHNVFWLGKKYKLGILLANLILAAFLFVWKSLFSISGTSRKAEPEKDEQPESHAASGLANLFRRGIPGKDILPSCIAEWKKTAARRNIPRDEMTAIDELSREKVKTVGAYNKIHEIIYGVKARKK